MAPSIWNRRKRHAAYRRVSHNPLVLNPEGDIRPLLLCDARRWSSTEKDAHRSSKETSLQSVSTPASITPILQSTQDSRPYWRNTSLKAFAGWSTILLPGAPSVDESTGCSKTPRSVHSRDRCVAPMPTSVCIAIIDVKYHTVLPFDLQEDPQHARPEDRSPTGRKHGPRQLPQHLKAG